MWAERRTRRARLILLTASLVLASCSSSSTSRRAGSDQSGMASWYGPGFHGRATSSGEIFDQHAMTAAHRTLPLGTRVKVTNLDNGRVTQVRINDRGPFVRNREIDLSYAAARELEMLGPGMCHVKLEPLLGAGETLAAVQFAVQVGAFENELRAQAYRERLARIAFAGDGDETHPAVYVVPTESADGRVYRVRVGPYPARPQAESSAARLASAAGVAAVVVEETASFR